MIIELKRHRVLQFALVRLVGAASSLLAVINYHMQIKDLLTSKIPSRIGITPNEIKPKTI